MSTAPQRDDLYEILGVDSGADTSKIRRAWRKKTKTLGPGSPEFAKLNDAAEVLLDPVKREAYDRRMAASLDDGSEETSAPDPAEPPVELAVPAQPPAAPTAKGGQPDPRRRGWILVVSIAGVFALVAIALVTWQAIARGTSHDPVGPGAGAVSPAGFDVPDDVNQAVLSTVRTGLAAVLSYNYSQMASDQANAERFLAPSLRPSLAANFKRLTEGGTPPGCKRPLAPVAQTKTVVSASVIDVGVVSISEDKATVGAFVDQTTTTSKKAATTTQNRVLVGLVKQDGTWLINAMNVPNTDGILSC